MAKITSTTYFSVPTQTFFWDNDNNGWNVGIAYGEEIICGCCGGVFEIADIYENAPIPDPIRPYGDWIDISEEIAGGELPKGYTEEDFKEVSANVD